MTEAFAGWERLGDRYSPGVVDGGHYEVRWRDKLVVADDRPRVPRVFRLACQAVETAALDAPGDK